MTWCLRRPMKSTRKVYPPCFALHRVSELSLWTDVLQGVPSSRNESNQEQDLARRGNRISLATIGHMSRSRLDLPLFDSGREMSATWRSSSNWYRHRSNQRERRIDHGGIIECSDAQKIRFGIHVFATVTSSFICRVLYLTSKNGFSILLYNTEQWWEWGWYQRVYYCSDKE